MPTVGIKKRVLDKHLGKVYTEKEFDELCFEYGLELDEVTTEQAAKEKELGGTQTKDTVQLSEEEVYKIELPANRYDLLSVEGLARALRVFKEEIPAPEYKFVDPPGGKHQQIIVKPETKDVREFVVGAILRDIAFDADNYASFIDLQDKLHQNICRKRTLVSMGTHDLDTIKGPFYYKAEKPSDIKFKPLNQNKEFTAEELMTLYSTDSHLKPYLPIIKDKARYPVIYDSNGVVCSMPPIINGEHSKITLNTKNVFIEVTATDKHKASIVLDTVVALFGQYCKREFTVERVEIVYEATEEKELYPLLAYRDMEVTCPEINVKMGMSLTDDQMANLLNRMSLKAIVVSKDLLKIRIPPTRQDILHACDIAEDVGVAYGFNNLVRKLPEAMTIAAAQPLNKLSDALRFECAAAGWTEALNFALCSREDISTNLRQPDALNGAVHIANPKTLEFQVARSSLLPGLLKTLANNLTMPLPMKLFELQDVIFKDDKADVGARNERRLAVVYFNKAAGFEIIHGLLDRLMRCLDINFGKGVNEYTIVQEDNPTFFPGRCAAIHGPGGVKLGYLGSLHPEVITAFGLALPVCALEITIEPFV